jgi:hypothetical protein
LENRERRRCSEREERWKKKIVMEIRGGERRDGRGRDGRGEGKERIRVGGGDD